MYYVIFKDCSNGKEEICVSQKVFETRKDAISYALTIAPSREAKILKVDCFYQYDEETGDASLLMA